MQLLKQLMIELQRQRLLGSIMHLQKMHQMLFLLNQKLKEKSRVKKDSAQANQGKGFLG